MTILELLKHTGIEQLQAQWLHESFVSAHINKQNGRIEFATDKDKAMSFSEDHPRVRGIVLWFKSEQLPESMR